MIQPLKNLKVVLTNDDGCPDNVHSPFVKYLVEAIELSTNWDLTICVPSEQKSWIGKAYFADKDLTGSYIYSAISKPEDNSYFGPFSQPNPEYQSDPSLKEWCLVDGTPASCCDIGLNHLSNPKEVDLVISGPNLGRNSTALYALSSGTFGGALEACHHNKKAVVLSYAFDEFTSTVYDEFSTDPSILREAAKISVKMIQKLYDNWNPEVDLYSINVPLVDTLKLGETKMVWAPMMQNRWGSSLFKKANLSGTSINYKWDPNYVEVCRSIQESTIPTDGKLVEDGFVTVTGMKSLYHQTEYEHCEFTL
ncbi:hypothetical protein CANARDRAFT_30616 [[Candida] arabinofermentans NRRL YB-2248]|uniref:Survival protein SurE-like phosphatase/nucleotidase domain-containing protein n=1 Tax=[Candida] arabinofermentans NRRL YB-2248 TaxID=983967 RepID=A0A1E4ST52_9ASCO|nr:hypothetical protein CANARDRAFT_30616 [[Candida] arabinofermentans NRRL YB-2248]